MFILLLSTVLVSCSFHGPMEADTPQIRVDLKGNNGFISFDEVFSEVKYLPLGVNGDKRIQRIDKLFITPEDEFVVVDKQQQRIYRFDSMGNPLYSIYRPGSGPDEYVEISDVAYNEVTGETLILDLGSPGILYFDQHGNFLQKKTSETLKQSGPSFSAHGDRLLFDRGHYPLDGNNLGVFDAGTLDFKASFIPLSNFNIRWGTAMENVFSAVQDTIYYLAPLLYAIYRIPPGGVPEKAYDIDFVEQQPDVKEVNDQGFTSPQQFYTYFSQQDIIDRVYGLYVTESDLFFLFIRDGAIKHHVWFDRKSGTTKTFYDLKGDIGLRVWNRNIIGTKGTTFIGAIYEPLHKLNIAMAHKFPIYPYETNPTLVFYTMAD